MQELVRENRPVAITGKPTLSSPIGWVKRAGTIRKDKQFVRGPAEEA